MATEFDIRKERFYNELQYIYSELYRWRSDTFPTLLQILREGNKNRTPALKKKDRAAMCNMNWYRTSARQDRLIEGKEKRGILTLAGNFEQPEVFLLAVKKLLEEANLGTELLEIRGIDGLFCIPGTAWQNKTKVHIVLRILRIVCEIVCPSVLLYGRFPARNEDYTAYFGTPEKPELHLMSDPRLLATLWQTVATHDTRALANLLRTDAGLPENRIFLREREEESGIFWDLDFVYLEMLGMNEESHKKFLQSYFTGSFRESRSHAHRVKDKESGEWGVRGTMDEMTGENKKLAELLDAFFIMQSGIPVPQEKKTAAKLLRIRRDCHVFDCGADIWTPGTDNDTAVGMGRYKDGQKFYGLYNFSDTEQIFSLHDPGLYRNLLTGKEVQIVNLVRLQPYSFAWILGR